MSSLSYNLVSRFPENLKFSSDTLERANETLYSIAKRQAEFREKAFLKACIAHMGHYPSEEEIRTRCHLYHFPNGLHTPAMRPGSVMLKIDNKPAVAIHPAETDETTFACKLTAEFFDPQPA